MISGVNELSVETSKRRTIVGSGSERQRSVGRVRSRVKTYDTGVPSAAAAAAVASLGGSTTSSVGAEPGVDLGEPDGSRVPGRGSDRGRRPNQR